MAQSDHIEHEITVSWKHRVFFADNVFAPDHLLLARLLAGGTPSPARVMFVVDESLAAAQPDLLPAIGAYCDHHRAAPELVRAPLVIEGGERVKNSYYHVSEIHSAIDTHHIDRHSTVVAVGGGALLDMAGLAAATAHRGVRHIRLPSTTLSQADSGVGVKNAINAFGKKNFIGTFAPPHAVVNDFQLLRTLPERDLRFGYAEAVKVACIRDRAFFEDLERDAAALRAFEPGPLRTLIRRCAELHARHIATSGDPFESGSTRPLDFGHWAAHKLEQMSGYRLRHGEAVAIGIALDTLYARRVGMLEPAGAGRVLTLLEALGFDLFVNELLHENSDGQPQVLDGLDEFKEHLGGRLTITLLAGIGEGVEVHEMNAAAISAALQELRQRHDQTARRILPVRSARP